MSKELHHDLDCLRNSGPVGGGVAPSGSRVEVASNVRYSGRIEVLLGILLHDIHTLRNESFSGFVIKR